MWSRGVPRSPSGVQSVREASLISVNQEERQELTCLEGMQQTQAPGTELQKCAALLAHHFSSMLAKWRC